MTPIELLVTPGNAALATRFILNMDKNAIEEKYQTLGIKAIFDFEETKYCYRNHYGVSLAEKVINLSKILKDEAKQQLADFLTTTQLIK